MDGVPVKNLARDMDIQVDQLTEELASIGIPVSSPDDLVSGTQQLQLLKHMRASDNDKEKEPSKDVALKDIEAATDLRELNQFLTQSMADRKIQGLIKDDNLELVTEKVLELNLETDEYELLTAAILGRLAAVARGREHQVFARANDIFSEEPGSIENLDDGDAKTYAASIIAHCDEDWVKEYSYREAFAIDTADNARRQLLTANLKREATLTEWLTGLTGHAKALRDIEKPESRWRRVRRITTALEVITDSWRGEPGEDVGNAMDRLMKGLFNRNPDDVDFSIIIESIDYFLAVLRRTIELRFSMALYPDLYTVLIDGKTVLGAATWGRFLDQSETMSEIRHALLEAALVLARQDKFDNDMIVVLRASYASRAKMLSALKKRFSSAKDLDPTVSEWWQEGGGGHGDMEQKAQRIRNTEDEKIGELLLTIEESQSVMEKLRSAVLPILKSMNPALATTVEKASADYRETSRVVRSLSRMRQLKPAELMSERLEYNRRMHDMEGGHKSGVRNVRVIRDGIEKTFAGKTKMLVKPIVTPEE